MIPNDDEKFNALEPNVIGVVTFSASRKVLNHSRAIYNTLDFLGDIGGLSDALKLIASFLVSVFPRVNLTNKLISKIFYAKP